MFNSSKKRLLIVKFFLLLSVIFSVGSTTPTMVLGRKTLLNDLHAVLISSDPDRFELHLVIANGSIFDSPTKRGTALLTAQYVLRQFQENYALLSTEEYSADGLNSSVEVTSDAIHFIINGAPKVLEQVGNGLADALVSTEFTQERLNLIKEQQIKELVKDDGRPSVVAIDEFLNLVFSPFPYAANSKGTTTSLKNIELADVVKFAHKMLIPNSAVVILSAPMDKKNFQQFMARSFGRWVKRENTPFRFSSPTPDQRSKTVWIQLPSAENTYIIVGSEAFRQRNEDYLAAQFLVGILSRHLQKIEQEFPGYHLEADLVGMMLSGYFTLRISGPKTADFVILEKILALLDSLGKGEFSMDEFKEARQNWDEGYSGLLKTPSSIAHLLTEVELFRLGERYIESYQARANVVIKEDLQFCAEKIFSTRSLKCVIVTPDSPLDNKIPKVLGPVSTKVWEREPAVN